MYPSFLRFHNLEKIFQLILPRLKRNVKIKWRQCQSSIRLSDQQIDFISSPPFQQFNNQRYTPNFLSWSCPSKTTVSSQLGYYLGGLTLGRLCLDHKCVSIVAGDCCVKSGLLGANAHHGGGR